MRNLLVMDEILSEMDIYPVIACSGLVSAPFTGTTPWLCRGLGVVGGGKTLEVDCSSSNE